MKKRVFKKWNKKIVKHELTKLAKLLGHSPSVSETQPILYQACWRNFGSFNKAKIASNLEITLLKNNKLSKKATFLSKELAYILGVIYGDGHVRDGKNYKRGSGQILLKVRDKDFALEFQKILKKWSNFDVKFFLDKRNFYNSVLYSTDAALFLMNFDLDRISKASNVIQGFFLKGLFDSEGSIAGSNLDQPQIATRYVGFYNNNKKIVDLVSRLLKCINIKHSVRSRVHSGFGSKKIQYELYISGSQNMYSFYKNIGFSIKRKQEKLKKVLNSYKIHPRLIISNLG